MAAREANKLLFEVLDECAFQPILQTEEKDVPENKRYKLPQIKHALAEQRERFHNCVSDEEVYQSYHEHLGTEEAEKINFELRDLNLPALTDCREQFENTASTLFDKGVRKHSHLP